MADELAVNRRTLGLALMCVCTWWETEVKRIGAVRAGREFLNLKHSRFPRIKLYSLVAAREWKSLRTLTLRRNDPQLMRVLTGAGVASICAAPSISPISRVVPCQDFDKSPVSALTLSNLTEFLLQSVNLAGDQLNAKKPKLRRAAKRALVAPDVPKVQRQWEIDAVDPDLPDAMKARMGAGQSMRFSD
jgi:hypothetical protein